jgi:hypothetical protein
MKALAVLMWIVCAISILAAASLFAQLYEAGRGLFMEVDVKRTSDERLVQRLEEEQETASNWLAVCTGAGLVSGVLALVCTLQGFRTKRARLYEKYKGNVTPQ